MPLQRRFAVPAPGAALAGETFRHLLYRQRRALLTLIVDERRDQRLSSGRGGAAAKVRASPFAPSFQNFCSNTSWTFFAFQEGQRRPFRGQHSGFGSRPFFVAALRGQTNLRNNAPDLLNPVASLKSERRMARSSSREDTALLRLVHGFDSRRRRRYFLSKLDNLLGPTELNRAGSSSIT